MASKDRRHFIQEARRRLARRDMCERRAMSDLQMIRCTIPNPITFGTAALVSASATPEENIGSYV
jgi:hypothetical protein